jgi:hypothetical protein
MYTNAPEGEQVTMVYVFGIKFHADIAHYGIGSVIEAAGISTPYKTELTKAVKLAKYVVPRNGDKFQ